MQRLRGRRFPPGPACQSCAAYDRGYDVAAGTGTVFSYVVHRHPPVPGKELPIVIALIDLDEGVRMVGEVVDVADDEIEIGTRLRVDFREVDDELTLPVWRRAMRTLEAGQAIPEWSLPMTPTTIVSTAIATRDWQDVHHDRDVAQAAGSKDIFMNILTTNGLVERYVADWAGPRRRAQGDRDPARRARPPLRHADLQRHGRPSVAGRRSRRSTSSGRVSLGDHVDRHRARWRLR